MKTNNTTNTNTNTSTANTNTGKISALAYVSAHKSEICGELSELQDTLRKAYMREEHEHTQFNGRLATLCKSVESPVLRKLLNSIEFKVTCRQYLPHVEYAAARDGEAVRKYIQLCKYVLVEDEAKVVKLDESVVLKYNQSIKLAKGESLIPVGYRFATDEDFVHTTDMGALIEHDYKRNVTKTITDEDGTEYQVPVYVVNEDGQKKVATEITKGNFYPVLSETVSPKAFINAVNKALADMWLLLFPAKQEESAEKAA